MLSSSILITFVRIPAFAIQQMHWVCSPNRFSSILSARVSNGASLCVHHRQRRPLQIRVFAQISILILQNVLHLASVYLASFRQIQILSWCQNQTKRNALLCSALTVSGINKHFISLIHKPLVVLFTLIPVFRYKCCSDDYLRSYITASDLLIYIIMSIWPT